MRKMTYLEIIIGLVIFLGAGIALSQTLINYQGILTDKEGFPLEGNYSLKFSLCQDENCTAEPIWNEAWNDSTSPINITDGLFNLGLGRYSPLEGIQFNQPLWLRVNVTDPISGNETSFSPQQLTAVPYALGSLGDFSLAGALRFSDGSTQTSAYVLENVLWTTDGVNIYTNKPGNVGIGTTGPGRQLHVQGDGAMRLQTTGGFYELNVGDTTGDLFFQSNQAVDPTITFARAGGLAVGSGYTSANPGNGNVVISGNVGIGTTEPSTALVVKGTDNPTMLVTGGGFTVNTPTNSAAFAITFPSPVGAEMRMWDEAGSENIRLWATGNSYFNGGNVGIGTTSPGFPLVVERSSPSSIYANNTAGADILMQADSSRSYIGTVKDYELVIGTNNTAKVAVTSAGNVGIGTEPYFKLHVLGNSTVGRFSNGTVDISLYTDPSNVFASMGAASNHDLRLFSNGTDYLTIKTNGNVGIGTTEPQAKLDVTGQIKISGGSPGSGKVLTSDASGLASWQTPTGGISGSGTTNYLSKWTGSNSLDNSVIYDDGTNVGIGTVDPGSYKLNVNGSVNATSGLYDNGSRVLTSESDPTVLSSVKDGISWTEVSDKPTSITRIGNISKSYGSLNISGSTGDYAGIYFPDEDRILMIDSIYQGIYQEGGVGWQWRWDNGTLAVGTVPASLISGTVASASYASSAGGVAWGNVSDKPSGFSDNVDDVGITSESDPQVGSMSTNYLSKWDGDSLENSTIYDNGNVGIGIIPSGKLHVEGDVIRLSSGSKYIQMRTSGTNLDIDSSGVLSINYSGPNVGIGSIPEEKLDVGGNLKVRSHVYIDGDLTLGYVSGYGNIRAIRGFFHGQSTTGEGTVLIVGNDARLADINIANTVGVYGQQSGTWGYLKTYITNPSSQEYKYNISPLTSQDTTKILNTLKALELKTFHLKSEKSDTEKHLGVIAEEAPSLILSREDSTGISISDFVSLAILGAKEALSQIEQLKSENDLLRKRLEALEKRIR